MFVEVTRGLLMAAVLGLAWLKQMDCARRTVCVAVDVAMVLCR
jgi:hypothetical protein